MLGSDLEPSTLLTLADRMDRWPEERFSKPFVIAYIRKAAEIHANYRSRHGSSQLSCHTERGKASDSCKMQDFIHGFHTGMMLMIEICCGGGKEERL